MPNSFPAADRKFINDLADSLHLSITWDEYDEQDQNLVTWRFPGELDEPVPENGENGKVKEEDDDEEWEDEEDEESRIAVDRVLAKYEKAKVADDDKDGDFDARYELSIKEKMDEWKRGYYKVRLTCVSHHLVISMYSLPGQTRNLLRQPSRDARSDVSLCGGHAMGYALLLQWCGIVGLVLQLPLCSSYIR